MNNIEDLEKIKNEIEERKKNSVPNTFIVNEPTLTVEVDKNKSYSEQAKDFVGAVATKKAE